MTGGGGSAMTGTRAGPWRGRIPLTISLQTVNYGANKLRKT